jgi:hypothetical protein
MVTVMVEAIVVAWRQHVDTQAMLARMEANLARDRRLAEIRDGLYLESLPEERRVQELEWRAELAAREILVEEEAARGDGPDART